MKNNTYRVYFTTGQIEEVYQGSINEAKIVAQALQIGKGHKYDVESIFIQNDKTKEWTKCSLF